MNDEALRHHAARAGIETKWRDVTGQTRHVPAHVLRAVLDALGELPDRTHPPMVTADCGQPIVLPGQPGPYRLLRDGGDTHESWAEPAHDGHIVIAAIDEPGYHVLQIGDRQCILAVAPPRCWTVADATQGRHAWGLTVQLYALRRNGDGGIGDFAALEMMGHQAGTLGAAAIAISPVHAQFSADPGRFSPYSPSSRGMLNVLHAAATAGMAPDPALPLLEAGALIDWHTAGPLHITALRRIFDGISRHNDLRSAFERFRKTGGDSLERHARFEALHQYHFQGTPQRWNWRDWPAFYRDPDSAEVARFATDHAPEVAFHAFAQFLADRGLQSAQHAARQAGMPIGLIADVAVGVDLGGSDSWRRPNEMLQGLTIGAPPDVFNPNGQNWGVTTYSPHGLAANGFGAFLEMLRASLRHAGGVRIDHVMSLARLWVIPEGSAEGAYLRFPLDDLLRLVKLESWRHRAIVLGEDLGTLPDGFRGRLEQAGLAGMRVLWFERDGDRFIPPKIWSPDAIAMTSTHDLTTVAGWWTSHDLAWQAALGIRDVEPDRIARERDRAALWAAFRDSGATSAHQPDASAPRPVVDAASTHIGLSACALALLPMEDALALPEQPNIPGTRDEHPNWRRRLPLPAESMLAAPETAARLEKLARCRP
jgi:4-alpha-glucanotransferase